MAARLQFWFEFASTYSYLSACRISDAATAHGVEVDWKPFLLGPIFAAQGWNNSPFNIYPAKGKYMWRDMERLCAQRGLEFHQPAEFPQNGLKAARLTLAAETKGKAPKFVEQVYLAQFAKGLNIADDTTLMDCLNDVGLDDETVQNAQSSSIKNALRKNTQTAQSLGIFGAPSFIVGTELFWGDDRLDQALAFAAAH